MARPIRIDSALASRDNLIKMEQNFACEYDHVLRSGPLAGSIEYEGPGESTTQHPISIKFFAISMRQKSRTIFSGAIRPIDDYMLGKVPRQMFHNNPANTLNDARDRSMKNYQRPLTSKKRTNLTSWFSAAGDNYIATSSLLWLDDLNQAIDDDQAEEYSAQGTGYRQQKVSLPGFAGSCFEFCIPVVDNSSGSSGIKIRVKRECRGSHGSSHSSFTLSNNNWFDYCPICEWNGKPGEIIDGQHRISGSALSTKSTQLIPCNFVLGDDFNSAEKSKMFSEVTVEATSLDDLHAVNLVYRMRPRRDHKKMKFATEPDRVLLYEAVMNMTDAGGNLENRFTVVPNEQLGKPRGTMANIVQMVDWMFESDLIGALNSVNSNWLGISHKSSHNSK